MGNNFLKEVLSSWEINSAWVKDVAAQGVKYDLVTFDIFDTALTRDVDSPFDIFAKVEKELLKVNENFSGFASAREQAEEEARHLVFQQSGFGEVTLDEVYQYLPRFLSLSKGEIKQAKLQEYAEESSSLAAVPDILSCTESLTQAGIAYGFVSDMYLPPEFLEKILSREGYKNWQYCIVSNAYRRTKAAGDIWNIAPLKDKNILHIGDNKESDGENPKKYGVETLLYTRARSHTRYGCKLTPAVLPFSVSHRCAELTVRAAIPPLQGEEKDAQEMYVLGKSFGLVIVGSFTFWLLERAQKNKITHLAFCARDGWLTQKAWHILTKDENHGISDSYLYVSRNVLTLGEAALTCSSEHVSDTVLDFLYQYDNQTTVASVLERLNALSPQLAKRAAGILGRKSALICRRRRYKALRRFLQGESVALYQIFEKYYKEIIGYFSQEKLAGHERLGLVDMGWHGTMQRGLNALCQEIKPDFSCVGFYYGLWSHAIFNRYLSGPMESAFFNEFSPLGEYPKIRQGIDFLEDVHTAPEGTTVGYECKDDHWLPITKRAGIDKFNFDNFIEPFQRGTLEALQELAETGQTTGGLRKEDLTTEAGYAAYRLLSLSASLDEIQAVGKIQHATLPDHQDFNNLAQLRIPRRQKKYHQSMNSYAWKMAIMRQWLASARSAREMRHLRKFVKQEFSYLDSRELRYFK